MKLIFILLSTLILQTVNAEGDTLSLDFQRNIFPLNGTWQILYDHPEENQMLENPLGSSYAWKEAEVPVKVLDGYDRKKIEALKCLWYKREFMLKEEPGDRQAVLKWNGIRFGASIWINNKLLSRYAPIGPNTVLIPTNYLKQGKNVILIKANGWSDLEKSGKPKTDNPTVSAFPLVPVGASTQAWGTKAPLIYDDIWIEFYHDAYLKWIYAMPDIDRKSVGFRFWLDALGNLPEDLVLSVKVLDSQDSVIGEERYPIASLKQSQDVRISLSKLELWSPESPVLNKVTLTLRHGVMLCDSVSFRYGMKKFEVMNGDYYLNNKRIRLHGSNLVNEWNWGVNNVFNQETKRYIVDEARNMNLNCFRTHTLPPVTSWLNVADEYGTMFLAEMPILFNYADPSFTDEDWKVFHENALADVTGWITKIWNHPSVVIWVISNESKSNNTWEQTVLRDYFKSFDPLRPVLRSGEITKETCDFHLCGNFNSLPEGSLMQSIAEEYKLAKPGQTFSNTEYMNLFDSWKNITTKYLGSPDDTCDKLNMAEIAMEHTEFMRQADLDLILPYMYAGWTGLRGNNWRSDYPTPMAASLHSCMAPVLASAELWNRNFLCGEEITFPLHLINDLTKDINTQITVYLTNRDPLFVPDAEVLKENLLDTAFNLNFPALSHDRLEFKVKLPEKPGKYFLSVVLRRQGDKPVTSQRVVRTMLPSNEGTPKKLVVLGADDEAIDWLNEHHYTFNTSADAAGKADVIVIWDVERLDDYTMSKTNAILKAVRKSARLVILEQDSWNWTELADFTVHDAYGKSRLFPTAGSEDDPIFNNLPNAYFIRWNGIPFNVAEREIKGPFVDRSEKLIWGENPGIIYAAKSMLGSGEIIVSQLLTKDHIRKDNGNYDPAAEQFLYNLLRKPSSKIAAKSD